MIRGHAAGDRVLIEVARRLAEFGGNRHIPYRLGGDEFAVVLTAYIQTMKSSESAPRCRKSLIVLLTCITAI